MEGTIRSTETEAPPEEVFAVASDVAAYPEWATCVSEVEVLETDDEGRARRVSFEVEGFIKRIRYTLEYDYDPPHEMRWTAEPGEDITEMEGSYRFNALPDGGTEIVYALRVQPAFTVPGFLRRQAEKQIVGAALRGLRLRVEQANGI